MKKILLGLHDKEGLEDFFRMFFRFNTCEIEVERTPGGIEKRLSSGEYDMCIMEANHGKPGSEDVNPAKSAYDLVREKVEAEKMAFLAISSMPEAVENARRYGIPAAEKPFKLGALDYLLRSLKS
jgi:hypothetical protein